MLLVHGHHELERFEEVVGDAGQDGLLAQPLGDEAQVQLGQVAHAAVQQLGGAARRAGGEVGLLDEGDVEAPGRQVEGAAGARDPATDDDDVERSFVQQTAGVLRSGPAHRHGVIVPRRQRPSATGRSGSAARGQVELVDRADEVGAEAVVGILGHRREPRRPVDAGP